MAAAAISRRAFLEKLGAASVALAVASIAPATAALSLEAVAPPHVDPIIAAKWSDITDGERDFWSQFFKLSEPDQDKVMTYVLAHRRNATA